MTTDPQPDAMIAENRRIRAYLRRVRDEARTVVPLHGIYHPRVIQALRDLRSQLIREQKRGG